MFLYSFTANYTIAKGWTIRKESMGTVGRKQKDRTGKKEPKKLSRALAKNRKNIFAVRTKRIND